MFRRRRFAVRFADGRQLVSGQLRAAERRPSGIVSLTKLEAVNFEIRKLRGTRFFSRNLIALYPQGRFED